MIPAFWHTRSQTAEISLHNEEREIMWLKETFDIIEHEGASWFCVRYETSAYDRPEKITHWWPIARIEDRPFFDERYPGILGTEAIDCHDGVYQWRRAAFDYEKFHLTDYGKTKPIKTTVEPWMAPKTKLETRWQSGQWQKYLKRQGWVTA